MYTYYLTWSKGPCEVLPWLCLHIGQLACNMSIFSCLPFFRPDLPRFDLKLLWFRRLKRLKGLTPNMMILLLLCQICIFCWISLNNSCLENGKKFVVDFTVSEIWENQNSYFNGLKIKIRPYVKLIKYFFWKSRLDWA